MSETMIIISGLSTSFLFLGLGAWFQTHVDRRIKARGYLMSAVGQFT